MVKLSMGAQRKRRKGFDLRTMVACIGIRKPNINGDNLSSVRIYALLIKAFRVYEICNVAKVSYAH